MTSPLHSSSRRALLLAAGAFALIACGKTDTAADAVADSTAVAAAPAAPNVVEISAGDYFYTMADTLLSGATTFRLTTNGQEMHHVQLVRVPDDKGIDELMGAMQGGGPAPEWAEFVGGPNAPTPMSGTSSVTLDLQPGKYIALCVIPSPDGAPHVAKGMSKTLVVTQNPAAAALPAATITMSLTDYDFALSAPLTAGSHVMQVTNNAEQEHEVFIAKLAPGATAAQLLSWIEKPNGPPPGEAMGGTVGMDKGMSNLVHLDLTPGEYALLCFIPDAKDGKPHFVHGMMKQISVM
jgi:hypothetical protein